MTRRVWAGPLVMLTLLAAAGGRAAGDEPRPVPLALVVTDARGRTISNLTAADVEIIESGEKRPVSSVTPRGPSPRVIGILLDEYHVSPGPNTDRVRTAALALVDRYLRPDDRVIVLKPLEPQSSARPAASLDEVRSRILGFSGRKGDFAPRSTLEAEYMSVAGPSAVRQRAQVMRAGLEVLTTAMREPENAAKALIVLTEGFSAEERSRTRLMTLRSTTRAAAMASIPVYIADPSSEPDGDARFGELWRALASQTGGQLISGAPDLTAALSKVGDDLRAQYLVRFQSSGKEDGGFHGLDVKARRPGARVRGPSGYWAPFAPSRIVSAPRADYSALLTPHVSGLVQPWFRMAPGTDGRTRVTFFWTPRRDAAATITFTALTFEGERLHEASLPRARQATAASPETSFEMAPGQVQISLQVANASGRVLDTDVRYIDVPRLDTARPVISAVEFIRPRSLPEFTTLQQDASAAPTDVREFLRQDRLLLRVRAFADGRRADVRLRLLNAVGDLLLELPRLDAIGDAAQFELPFARFARGNYRLEVRAVGQTESVTQLLSVRLIG